MCSGSIMEEEIPEYTTSGLIQDLLSTVPEIPLALRKRLHDAHCHPTDTPGSLSQVDFETSGSLCAMSTRPKDQPLVHKFSADNPDTVVPFFGYHPWFAHLFSVDGNDGHYQSILKPSPPQEFISHLPEPLEWRECLEKLRDYLKLNPKAQVGEIGLDKSFRLPSHVNGERDVSTPKVLSPYRTTQEHQLRLFMDQCKLAGEFGRAVSVHSVQCHGTLFAALQSLWKDHRKRGMKLKDKNNAEEMRSNTFPPRICIHSASLPIDTLKQYLQPSIPSQIFFSFSTAINARYGQKLLDLISAVPDDRILVESDWNSEGLIRRKQLHDIARIIIHTKHWSVDHGIEILEQNFHQFIYGNDPR